MAPPEAPGPLSARVLRYMDTVARTAAKAKTSGIALADWDELAALVDTATFVRIASPTKRFGWQQHIAQLTQWAPQADFETTILDLREANGIVFARLVERNRINGVDRVVNAMSVYTFSAAGRITSLQTYRQVDPA
jgi:hypothetical protein